MSLNQMLLVNYKLVRAVATWLMSIGGHRLGALGPPATRLLRSVMMLAHLHIDQVMLRVIAIRDAQLV